MIYLTHNTLEHKTRKLIYNHILSFPGISFSRIKKILDMPGSTLRYHLNYLENKNEIKSSLIGKNKCYYPLQNTRNIYKPKFNNKLKKINTTQEKILNIIKQNPGITQKELIIKTRLSRLIIKYNIKKLIYFGIVRKNQIGRNVCYNYIQEDEIRNEVIKGLVNMLLNNEIDEQTFLNLKRKLEK